MAKRKNKNTEAEEQDAPVEETAEQEQTNDVPVEPQEDKPPREDSVESQDRPEVEPGMVLLRAKTNRRLWDGRVVCEGEEFTITEEYAGRLLKKDAKHFDVLS